MEKSMLMEELNQSRARFTEVQEALQVQSLRYAELDSEAQTLRANKEEQLTRIEELRDQAVILQTKVVTAERAAKEAESQHAARAADAEALVKEQEQSLTAAREEIEALQEKLSLYADSGDTVLQRFRMGNLTASEATLVQEISDANSRELTRMANEIKKLQAESMKKEAQNKTLLKKLNKESQGPQAPMQRTQTAGASRRQIFLSSEETNGSTGSNPAKQDEVQRQDAGVARKMGPKPAPAAGRASAPVTRSLALSEMLDVADAEPMTDHGIDNDLSTTSAAVNIRRAPRRA
ncbi:hypothetical protein U1Q18_051457 [Sarracenia purpurea var. burkii]